MRIAHHPGQFIYHDAVEQGDNLLVALAYIFFLGHVQLLPKTAKFTVQHALEQGHPPGAIEAADRGLWRRSRVVTTRAVNNIDWDVKLNKALWSLGERMANSLGLAA